MNRILMCSERGLEPYYAVLQTESGFWFHRLLGVELEKPMQAVFTPGPMDIMIDRDQIISKHLTMFAEHERDFGLYGKLTLYTAEEQCREFNFGKHPVSERFTVFHHDNTIRAARNLPAGGRIHTAARFDEYM